MPWILKNHSEPGIGLAGTIRSRQHAIISVRRRANRGALIEAKSVISSKGESCAIRSSF